MKKIKEKKYSLLVVLAKYSFVFIIAFSVLMPVFVGANVAIDAKIANPLGTDGPQNIPDFIKKVIDIVLVIGIPILVLAIIYAGFLYVKAQGNSKELETAHKTLLFTIIGGALLLGAYVIANAIGKTVEDIKSTT